MEKMSSEAYLDMLDKLADEVIEGSEKTAETETDSLVKHALNFYERAQLVKEASEADFMRASAYEDAAIAIMEEFCSEE